MAVGSWTRRLARRRVRVFDYGQLKRHHRFTAGTIFRLRNTRICVLRVIIHTGAMPSHRTARPGDQPMSTPLERLQK
jgi:hypothetical protein